MLNICTCIISCLILIAWYSWTDHVIFTCELVFLWSCDYVTWQLLIQNISCALYTCHTMHAWSYCTWSIILIIPIIVITFSFWYRQPYCSYYFNAPLVLLLYFHILSFTVLSPSCTLVGPLLTDHYYFSVSKSENRYRELIIEYILVQLFFGEFNFISWLVLFRYGGWYCLCFSNSYMCFYPYAWLYIHICVLSCSLLTA